jgi:hypothetical protein
LLQGRLALGTPGRIVAVNPEINDVDGRIWLGMMALGFLKKARQSLAVAFEKLVNNPPSPEGHCTGDSGIV